MQLTMLLITQWVFLLCSFALQSSLANLAADHSFFAPLDENQNVKLYWNVSIARKEIIFTVEAKATGWVGFGISSGQGKMQGADIVIGWVKDGQTYFKDRHADGRFMPKIDSQQDYELISLEEDNGKTIMKFKRKLDTCDPQDNKIEAGTTKVIYAYHPEDPASENSILQHSLGNRGQRSVYLLNNANKEPTLPPDTKTFDIRHNMTVIPEDGTSYICKVFEIPKLNETHHIVKIEPVIQADHEGVVHHILVYECSDDFPKHLLNYTGRCYASNMPPQIRECAGLLTIAGWAIGGKGLKESKLPEGGINVFSALLHTHLAGRKAFLRHVRGGVELPEIIRDDNYDFNFQEYQVLSKEVHIAPGDALINVCIYDTNDRFLVTTGGISTYEEMCLTFAFYYPKVALSRCTSSEWPAVFNWAGKVGLRNLNETREPGFWTDNVNEGLVKAYKDSPQVYSFCASRGNPGKNVIKPKPLIRTPYKPESSCRLTESVGSKAVVPSHLGLLVTAVSLIAVSV